MAFNIQDQVKLNTILDSANNTGTLNQVLISTGSNTLIWSNQGDLSVNGSNTEILFNDSGLLGANNQFVFDKETGRVGIGTNSPTQALDVSGTINTSANVHITGAIRDTSGSFGTSGQVLSSTVTGLSWIDAGSVSGALTALNGVDNRVAVFTGADEIEGDANFTWNGTNLSVDGGAVFNETGADVDFRVESDTNDHALFVRGSDSAIGINNSNPTAGYALDIVSPDTGASTFTYVRLAPPSTATTAQSRLFFAGRSGGTDYESRISGGQLGGLYLTSPREVSLYYNTTTPTERLSADVSGVIINDPGNDVDFRVESDTNTHALFVQGSDGYVGIGTSAPSGAVHIETGASNPLVAGAADDLVIEGSLYTGITIASPETGGIGAIYFANENDFDQGSIRHFHGATGGSLTLGVNGINALTMRTDETIINEVGVDHDFRVESSANTHALFVQGSDGFVGIGESVPSAPLHITTGTVNPLTSSISNELIIEGSPYAGITIGAPETGGISAVYFANENDSGNGWVRHYHDSAFMALTLGVGGKDYQHIYPAATVINEGGNDHDFRVESDTLTHAFFVQGSDGFIGVNQSAPTFRFDLVDDAAAYVDGEKSVASFSSASDQRSFLKIRNNNSNATAGAPRAGLDLEVKDYANSPNVMRTWLELNQRNASGNGGGTSLTVPTTFAIFVDNDGDLTSSSGEYPSSQVIPGTQILYLANTQVIFNDPGNDVDFRVESSTNDHALFVQGSDGHVGIGTVSSSSYALHVSDADGILVESTGTTGIHKIVRGTAASQDSRPVIDIDADTTADAVDGFGPTLRFTFSDTGVDDSELGAIGFVRDGGDGLGKFVVGQDSQQLGSVGATQFSVGNAETVVNDQGVDTDFRVESDTNDHALFVRGSDGKVSIGGITTLALGDQKTNEVVIDDGTTYSTAITGGAGYIPQASDTLALVNKSSTGNYTSLHFRSVGPLGNAAGKIALVNQTGGDSKFAFMLRDSAGTDINEKMVIDNVGVTVNPLGADRDFRVESDNNDHALFLRGSDGTIGINTDVPEVNYALDIRSPDTVTTVNNHTDVKIGQASVSTQGLSRLRFNSRWAGVDYESSIAGGYLGELNLTSTGSSISYVRLIWGSSERIRANNTGVVVNEPGLDADFRVESNLNDHALFVQGSDGFVGVGESNPLGTMHITTASSSMITPNTAADDLIIENSFAGMTFASSNTGLGRINFADPQDTNTGFISYNHVDNNLTFGVDGGQDRLRLKPSESVFNESGADVDFRVESDTNTHALFVQGSDGAIGINNSFPTVALDVTTGDTGTDVSSRMRLNIPSGATDGFSQILLKGKSSSVDSVSSITNTKPGALTLGSAVEVVVNEDGNDADFRVESDTLTHALFVQGSDGNIGVGQSVPTQALDVVGTITTSANVHITGSIKDSSGDYGTSGQVLSSTATGINWIDAASGGVNATGTPVDNQIAVWTASDTIEGDANFTWSGTSLSVDGGAVFNESGNDQDFRIESSSNANAFKVDAGNGAGVLFSGGTTDTPWSVTTGNGNLAYRIDNGSAYGSLAMSNNADRGWSAMYINKFAYTSGDDQRYIQWWVNGSALASIQLNSAGTAIEYNTSSDRRLKENIVDIVDGIVRVKQLQPKKYTWIGTDFGAEGFIADEADGIVPEAVNGEPNAVDSDGNPIYMQIEYSRYIPLLTAALKETIAKNEELEARIAALENT